MTIHRCPNCYETFSVQPYDEDAEHTCNSTSTALNNEDVFNLAAANWNLLGSAKKRNGAHELGKPVSYDYTPRGNRASTHYSRQHVEYITNVGEHND